MRQTAVTPSPIVERQNTLLLSGMLLFLLLFTLTLYTFLHESGHALVGLLFGGRVTSFSANFFNLSAHVGIDGEFTRFQNALISAAGVSFPLLLVMLYGLTASKTEEPVMNWFRLLLFLSTVNSLLAWIAIPMLVLFGATVGDDASNFLNYTGIHPLIVTSAVLLVYLGCWALFLVRMGGFRTLAGQIRSARMNLHQTDTLKNIRSLGIIGVVIMAATYALTIAMPDLGFQAPEGYQTMAEFALSQGPLRDAVVFRFTITETTSTNFFIALNHVKGGPVQIHLVGPNDYDNVLFHDPNENLDIGKASVHPQNLPLAPGDYELRASFPQSKGRVRISIKSK